MPRITKKNLQWLEKNYKHPPSREAHKEGYRACREIIKQTLKSVTIDGAQISPEQVIEWVTTVVKDCPGDERNPYPYDRLRERAVTYVTEHGAFLEGWGGAWKDYKTTGKCQRF